MSRELWVSPATGMEMLYIPPGEFEMGSSRADCQPNQEPAHRVRITRGFWIGKYPVTQAEWDAVMDHNPSYFRGARFPAECVAWEDAQRFVRTLSEKGEGRYRLPTEAEWEYAARAGTQATFCYGDDLERLGEYAWYDRNCEESSHPVGLKKPNHWGLHDVHGNVSEWCEDWYGAYVEGLAIDPRGPESGHYRIARGGFWGDEEWDVWVSTRGGLVPEFNGRGCGLRAVRDADFNSNGMLL